MKLNSRIVAASSNAPHSPLVWSVTSSACIVIAMFAAYWIGPKHDYVSYMAQWELVLAGGDPWSTSNTYGPAHNFFSVLFVLHPLLPKLTFVFAWQVSSWYVLRQLERREIGRHWLVFWLAALPLNPLFWSFGVVYGSMDSLVAALCLTALACRQADRHSFSAAVLALAVLLKIYPIVFAPFLALEGRRINWQFLTTFAALLAVGFTFSLYMWGESTFNSITYNSGRGSKILSIFRFLRGDASPLKGWVDDFDQFSLPAMASGGSLILALAWKWRLPPVSGALAGILVTLLLYKVGHQQFFLVVPLAAGFWYAFRLPHGDWQLSGALIALLGWIAGVSALYLLTHVHGKVSGEFSGAFTGPWGFLRDWVGLPTFSILAWTLLALMSYERREAMK